MDNDIAQDSATILGPLPKWPGRNVDWSNLYNKPEAPYLSQAEDQDMPTFRQIAAELGVSHVQVSRDYHSGLKKMEKYFKNQVTGFEICDIVVEKTNFYLYITGILKEICEA